MTPLISIIVPVYNVERYLGACLDSIFRQTLPEIQIICVDDASTDGSASILDAAKKDRRIVVLKHSCNRGLSAARNTGLRAAQAPWVLFVDSDDLISSYLCERTLLATTQNAADVVFFDYAVFRDGQPAPAETNPTPSILADRHTLLRRPAFAWTKLVDTKLLRTKAIEFPEGLCFEDTPVHWRLVIESAHPVLLSEPLVWYRQRIGSITYRTDWSRADSILIYDSIKEYLRTTGRWEEWKNIFLVQQLRNLAHTHAYYARANRSLSQRVREETRARMTSEHWRVVLHGKDIQRWERDYLIACGQPTGGRTGLKLLLPILRNRLRDPLRCIWHRLGLARGI